MLIESTISLVKEENIVRKKKKKLLDYLPLKLKFRHSGIYISIILPISVGIITGLLASLMGVEEVL